MCVDYKLRNKKIDTLLPSEIKFLDTLCDGTTESDHLEHPTEIRQLVVRGSFLRELLLGNLGENLLPPKGLVVEGVQINGNVDLRGCSVDCPVSLRKCNIFGDLDLTGATIIELVLTGTLVGRIHLSEINCKGSIILSYGFRTLYPVVARGAKIGGQLGCSGGEFLGHPLAISLEAAEIQEAFFWRHVQNLWGIVDLTNTSVGCLVDDPDSWPSKGKLRLAGFTYGSVESNTSTIYYDRLDWLERQYEPHLTDDFRPQPFEQLVKVLHATGRENEAKKVAIRKLNYQRDADFLRRSRNVTKLAHQIRMTSNPFDQFVLKMKLENERKWSPDNFALFLIAGWSWLVSTMFWAFAGYGYRPARCIIWSIIMIAIGGWVFSGLYENGNIVQVAQNSINGASTYGANSPRFYPIAYAADVFIPLIDLRQASDWALLERTAEPIRPFLIFYWGYILMGWFSAAVFGASVTGLVRK
ncbi:hypothetical protein WNY61_13230 [Sulfitobacter sp. AS92]|uniref:hypothetical protein n=1 Tax=Sulfitobacter sp. AS92 TaxID=3135783 RepID=UPI0031715124